MRSTDLLKLDASHFFKIFRMNKIAENNYVLKEFEGHNNLSWNVLLYNCTWQEGLNKIRELKSVMINPLLVSEEMTTFDLVDISKRGFQILRERDDCYFNVEIFNAKTITWKTLKVFNYLNERNVYLAQQLLDPQIICI